MSSSWGAPPRCGEAPRGRSDVGVRHGQRSVWPPDLSGEIRLSRMLLDAPSAPRPHCSAPVAGRPDLVRVVFRPGVRESLSAVVVPGLPVEIDTRSACKRPGRLGLRRENPVKAPRRPYRPPRWPAIPGALSLSVVGAIPGSNVSAIKGAMFTYVPSGGFRVTASLGFVAQLGCHRPTAVSSGRMGFWITFGSVAHLRDHPDAPRRPFSRTPDCHKR